MTSSAPGPHSSQRPLHGIRILDLGEQLPGPYAALILADFGAEVIKLERPAGDIARSNFPGIFRIANRDKKSVCLDLKNESDRSSFLDLVRTADVLIEGFRPGVAARLGIDYPALSAVNDRLIYVSISGYGQTGPYRDVPGHDINYMAVSGALSMCGPPDGAPAYAVGFPIADVSASMTAAISILAALRARDASGAGQFIDVAIADCLLPMVAARYGTLQHQGGLSRRDILHRPGNGVYTTADDRQVAIGAVEDHFWLALVRALDLSELAEDRYRRFPDRLRHADFLQECLTKRIREKTLDQLLQDFSGHDIPASIVTGLGEIRSHPQLDARGIFADADGFSYVRFPGLPQAQPAATPAQPPELGADNEAILGRPVRPK